MMAALEDKRVLQQQQRLAKKIDERKGKSGPRRWDPVPASADDEP